MTQSDLKSRERAIELKSLAKENYGFDFVGISKAEFLAEEADRLDEWLKSKKQGDMKWMENHLEKRLDPRLLVEDTKVVVSFLYNYYPSEDIFENQTYKISKYAYGRDYHKVVKKKLNALLSELQLSWGNFNARAFVDSAPIMERQWAAKSGLGWQGKHTLLINKGHGSYYFIGNLLMDIELEADGPIKDYCGSCTRCVDACPTEAITPYQVDASKCISYLTIELKDQIPVEFKGKYKNWIFGCDICQEVCPWNRFTSPHKEADFIPKQSLRQMRQEDWEEIDLSEFQNLFYGTAVKRTGLEGLKRNIKFVHTPNTEVESKR
ncbi:MAG: tRNA epoxyqueuosine(34) reductase QueG [Cyclobacteriaceae bacterium]|nr:tRNA epoxyqueuosine(34) reductase QueG [Cyclobacteriaceae bacterium]MCH8517266.1 tRNA epoxyqueuosine(34) reductase QueG [Cyclobacteriaceae bacterium]